MTAHRPAADEAMNRTEGVQAGVVTVICWIWEFVSMGGTLFDTPKGIFIFLATPLGCWAITKGVRGAAALFAHKFIGGILSAGNLKYQQGYSRQEALIARGQFDEAAESFRLHLMEFPDDIPGRYRLATLHLRERNDPGAAEAELQNIRRRKHDRSMAKLLANHFIDLYRATGQTGKLMAELQKTVREWPGTPLAEGAARLLEETRRERGAAQGGAPETA